MPKTQSEKQFKIRLGTRASKLALVQADDMKRLILASSSLSENQIEIVKITTSGDKIKDVSLADIGGKGLFIKELEESLVEGKIDIAVHSAKDVPPVVHKDTEIAVFSQRIDPREYFISKKFDSISQLPQNAVVGTSSARRKAILLKIRPDLKVINFRGNVDTRLKKIEDEKAEATILAVCGLTRIGREINEKQTIPLDLMLPSVGQGCLLLQIRKNDDKISEILSKINNKESDVCVSAERSFLRILRASCRSPIAVYCQIQGAKIHFQSIIFDFDGKESFDLEYFEDVSHLIADFDGNYSKIKNMALELARKAAEATRNNARGLLERICR